MATRQDPKAVWNLKCGSDAEEAIYADSAYQSQAHWLWKKIEVLLNEIIAIANP